MQEMYKTSVEDVIGDALEVQIKRELCRERKARSRKESSE
jgi:hypothetical protein